MSLNKRRTTNSAPAEGQLERTYRSIQPIIPRKDTQIQQSGDQEKKGGSYGSCIETWRQEIIISGCEEGLLLPHAEEGKGMTGLNLINKKTTACAPEKIQNTCTRAHGLGIPSFTFCFRISPDVPPEELSWKYEISL
ncbi:MAG: hypothetical protein JXA44_03265 [Methanospirillaceae archaeon]|nr:hypothetical protein [Methanospirillaceae archaeon]